MRIRNPLLHAALAGLTTFGLTTAGAAQAQSSALDSIMPSGEVLLTDDSGENVYRDGQEIQGNIQEGDVMRGAIDITKIEDGGQGTFVNTTGRQFTALFQMEVAGISDTGQTAEYSGNTYEVWDFELQSAGAGAWDPYISDATADSLGIDKGQLSALFYDDSLSNTTFDRTSGDAEQELMDASDGQLRAAAGLVDSDDFWIARGPGDLQAFQDADLNEDVGDFFFGASWMYENFDRDFSEFSQNLGSSEIQNIAFAPGGSANVGLYGDGDLFGPSAESGFGVYNKANINVGPEEDQQIPEPATAALTGLGLMLMAAFGRRRPSRTTAGC
ncbi:PEP-CTERM sorting domain-containing protein [Thiohalorhabdus methylotrophus]|uniref:PEP-CTERM sorting domain-containing protein n=1 Tax=Thiohalorhabdus methylotrophus TaxID=3242694 RepID=A0ABV4TUK2_9GAMM